MFDRQLKSSETAGHVAATTEKTGRSWSVGRVFRWITGLLLLLLFPFWVLIRTAVYVNTALALNGWIALASGAVAAAVLLIIYALLANFLLRGSLSLHRYLRRSLMASVILFCGYGLLHVSALNVKDPALVEHYRSLHPILRISTATTVLFYDDLIITDMKRSPADYARMGLPENERSLHYPQSTGYVHAVDLRTAGMAEWKNRLLEWGFRLLGLSTLRHVGTADHLHVTLPVRS